MLRGRRYGKVLRALGVVGAAAAAVWMFAGAETRRPDDETVLSVPNAGSADGGMRAYIDPATGQLIEQPEHDQARTFAPAFAARASVVEIAGPDGAVGLVLDESMMTFSVATLGPDGTIAIHHARDASEALQSVNGAAPAKEERDDR